MPAKLPIGSGRLQGRPRPTALEAPWRSFTTYFNDNPKPIQRPTRLSISGYVVAVCQNPDHSKASHPDVWDKVSAGPASRMPRKYWGLMARHFTQHLNAGEE